MEMETAMYYTRAMVASIDNQLELVEEAAYPLYLYLNLSASLSEVLGYCAINAAVYCMM